LGNIGVVGSRLSTHHQPRCPGDHSRHSEGTAKRVQCKLTKLKTKDKILQGTVIVTK